MCLILFAWQSHPRYALVVAANRDEFHQRPAAPAQFWEDSPGVLAGRDLQAGGTWLGISRSGRFAAVTNYREPPVPEPQLELSRGHLVREYLESGEDPAGHANDLSSRGWQYRGFNLLLGSATTLWHVSNRNPAPMEVGRGVHGLSNHLLDTRWPKVDSGRQRLERLLQDDRVEPGALFALLTDKTLTPGEMPQDLESSLAPEQLMKHYFIVSPVYGTRCSTVLLVGRNGEIEFHERAFDPEGRTIDTRSFQFFID